MGLRVTPDERRHWSCCNGGQSYSDPDSYFSVGTRRALITAMRSTHPLAGVLSSTVGCAFSAFITSRKIALMRVCHRGCARKYSSTSLSSRMLIGSFSGGRSTRARSSHAGVMRGAASGSFLTSVAISSSVCASNLDQSVPLGGAVAGEFFAIRFAFISICLSCRNNAALVPTPCIDDNQNPVIDHTQSYKPVFSVVSSRVWPF